MTDAENLCAALDQMHGLILAADFSDLAKILAETEALTARLLPIKDRQMAERLRSKAHRNGLCLQAAARGLRAAQRRLGEVGSPTDRLSTYTRSGHRANVAAGTGTLAQRL
jgi:hypothetical protein